MSKRIMIPKGSPNGVPTGINWQDADFDSEAGRREVSKAINGYFNDIRGKNLGMKTTREGHIQLGHPDVIDVRVYGRMQDMRLMQMFRYIDKRRSKNPTHKFSNVDGGAIVFQQKHKGQKPRIQAVKANGATSIESVTWHGALGIDDEEKRFDEYSIFEQAVQTVPNVFDAFYSQQMGDLLVALSAAVDETWATDLIKTVNNGCAQIIEDVGDIYGLTDNPEFMLAYNHRDWEVVQQALASNYTVPNNNNSARKLQHNIIPAMTRTIPQGKVYLALPGHDIVDVEWDPLFAEYDRDGLGGVDNWIWRARRTPAIGNVQQVRRITLQ